MTGRYEDIEGGLLTFLDIRKGGSEKIVGLGGEAPKICILQNQQERGDPKKTEPLGMLKFQASSFSIFIPPCHIK